MQGYLEHAWLFELAMDLLGSISQLEEGLRLGGQQHQANTTRLQSGQWVESVYMQQHQANTTKLCNEQCVESVCMKS